MSIARLAALVGSVLLLPVLALAAEPPKLSDTQRKVQEALEKKDFDTAAKLLKAEAEKGNADAANMLGELFLSGRGVKASATDALKWFQKAADTGHAGAQLNIAKLLFAGAEGVPKDEEKARFLLHTAAEADQPAAQLYLGQMTEHAAKTNADAAEARRWFEKSAGQQFPDGLVALARCLDNGIGGERDPGKATELLTRAARAGSAMAMNEMGVRYQKGIGLRADNIAAIGWFTVGAQRGLPAALVNLGNCYEVGNGVRQDFDQAGRNYSAAARQNFGPAEFLLGQMIEQGRGTEVNLAHAYVLYTRAGAQKNEEAAKRAEAIKGKLTPAQLDEAAKLLRTGTMP
jgi:uncharacterized protein